MDSKLEASIADLEKLFSTRMTEYETKLQKVTSATSSTPPDTAALADDFAKFKDFVCLTLRHLKTQVRLISLGLDKHEIAMRRKVLLIHGLQEKSNENLSDSILNLFNKQLKLDDLSTANIEACHRLGASQAKTRPVLVRFNDMDSRRLVWDNKTSLKGSGITISEFLTKSRHQVFMSARKHFGVNKCWSAEGKIFILTPDKARHKIVTMDELTTLVAKYPASAEDSAVPGSVGSPKALVPKAKTVRKTRR